MGKKLVIIVLIFTIVLGGCTEQKRESFISKPITIPTLPAQVEKEPIPNEFEEEGKEVKLSEEQIAQLNHLLFKVFQANYMCSVEIESGEVVDGALETDEEKATFIYVLASDKQCSFTKKEIRRKVTSAVGEDIRDYDVLKTYFEYENGRYEMRESPGKLYGIPYIRVDRIVKKKEAHYLVSGVVGFGLYEEDKTRGNYYDFAASVQINKASVFGEYTVENMIYNKLRNGQDIKEE